MTEELNDREQLLIDKYLNDELSKDERSEFLNILHSSKSFAVEVELRASIISAQRARKKQELKDELRSIYASVKEGQKSAPGPAHTYRWAMAAAIILLFSIGYFFVFNTKSYDSLYSSYYEPYPADPILRGNNSSSIGKAMDLYRNGQYQKAIPLFNEFIQNSEASKRLYLFLGQCYLQLDNDVEAIESFRNAADASDGIIRQHAQWYLALGYLKNKDIDRCKHILTTIKNQEGLYKEQAENLLDDLR